MVNPKRAPFFYQGHHLTPFNSRAAGIGRRGRWKAAWETWSSLRPHQRSWARLGGWVSQQFGQTSEARCGFPLASFWFLGLLLGSLFLLVSF